jgi:hypothetical protein
MSRSATNPSISASKWVSDVSDKSARKAAVSDRLSLVLVDLLGHGSSRQTEPSPKNNRGRQATRAGFASLREGSAHPALPAAITPTVGTLLVCPVRSLAFKRNAPRQTCIHPIRSKWPQAGLVDRGLAALRSVLERHGAAAAQPGTASFCGLQFFRRYTLSRFFAAAITGANPSGNRCKASEALEPKERQGPLAGHLSKAGNAHRSKAGKAGLSASR